MMRNAGWSVSHRNSGLSVIELIVALAIIGILFALLVSAVQWARESARRLQCLSRMTEMGKALHSYESTRREFPSAMAGLRLTSGARDQFSPHYRLLPFLDQASLFTQVNYSGGTEFSVDPELSGIGVQQVPIFLCPSDGAQKGCSFRFSTGSSAYPYSGSKRLVGRGNGAFAPFETLRSADFVDGLSSTVGISEKIVASRDQAWSNGAFWYSGISELLGAYPETQVVVEACAVRDESVPTVGSHAGNAWLMGALDFTLYNHVVTPNSKVCDCSIHDVGPIPNHDADAGIFSARSYHAGGVNCVTMDGAGRFVSDGINLSIWKALSTRAGRDIVE